MTSKPHFIMLNLKKMKNYLSKFRKDMISIKNAESEGYYTLYRIYQSPRAFRKYFTQKLISGVIYQNNLCPCLFVGDKAICIVYVDDSIFWKNDESDIHYLEMKLRDIGVDL